MSNLEQTGRPGYHHLALRVAVTGLALAGMTLGMPALAQSGRGLGPETVSWTASVPADGVKPGGKVAITLQASVQDGWHVYGLKQLPAGPTPLSVALDANEIAKGDGAATGSAPVKFLDPGFGVETQYYAKPFTLTVPVRVSSKSQPGRQNVPVSVRFQTCNNQICQPPRTVRLSVPLNVQARG